MSVNLPTRRLVSQDEHAMTARPDVPRSRFSGTWTRKSSFDAGYLVPFLVDEILPGDHMKYDVTAYLRIATLFFPLFDNLKIDTFFFFTPNRLLWENWVKFMGEQNTPSDSIAFTIPQVVSAAGGFPDNSIYDHMGIPGVRQWDGGRTCSVSALPFRAYSLIIQEWFKDQNSIPTNYRPSVANGPDAVSQYSLVRRMKAHDYFTSSLPWPQKFTAPSVPLGGNAYVSGLGVAALQASITSPSVIQSTGVSEQYGLYGVTGTTSLYWRETGTRPDIYADLSTATGVAINVFRQAFLVQQLLERDARGGTRYTEIIKSHFGVTSPDARLQRPEYIGGGSSPLMITPIAQTATGGGGLGALAGAGTAAGSHRASFASTEHGWVIGLINVRSELSYGQGIPKSFKRSTRYDFYWPSLAGLGEQAVLREEIYAGRGTAADDLVVFGYQERWHEYRTRVSELAGEFRSGTDAAGLLAPWTVAQRFTAAPTLGQTFLEENPPMSTVIAAGGAAVNQQFLADIMIRREATRPIPMFGTPVTLGRF